MNMNVKGATRQDKKKLDNKLTSRPSARVVGQRRFVDQSTGETFSAEVIIKETADSNFRKIWIGHILEAIEEIGNAKMRVLFWMMENADNNNRIYGTVRGIAEATGVSAGTIQTLLKSLQLADVIRREFNGIWIFNPQIIFGGSHRRRMNVLISYRNSEQLELPGFESRLDDDALVA